MDMREASAMTEASGLVDHPDGTTPASGSRPRGEAEGNSRPLHSRLRQDPLRLSDEVRTLAREAPLTSLFMAFLLGVWVARRR